MVLRVLSNKEAGVDSGLFVYLRFALAEERT